MKKFSTYKETIITENTLEISIENIIKENLSIEISGMERPWSNDITITHDNKLYTEMRSILDKEISLSKIQLLESLKIAVYNNTILDVIDDEIKKLK